MYGKLNCEVKTNRADGQVSIQGYAYPFQMPSVFKLSFCKCCGTRYSIRSALFWSDTGEGISLTMYLMS